MSGTNERAHELTKRAITLLEEWTTLEGISDTGALWGALGGSGGLISFMCEVGAYVTFIMMLIAIFKRFMESGYSFRLSDYWLVLGKGGIVLIFFCGLYPVLSGMIADVATAINEDIAEGSMREFRAQLRQYLYTLQTPDADRDVGLVRRFFRGIGNLFNLVGVLSQTILITVTACAIQLLLIFVFIFMSVAPFFTLFTLAMGPLCMALWIVFPQIGRGWGSMLIASIFFSFVTLIGFATIAVSGVLNVASSSIMYTSHLQALIFIVLILVYLTMVPFIMAQVFNCSAFSFLGRALGWLYGLTVYLAPIMILSEILSFTVGTGFSKKARK